MASTPEFLAPPVAGVSVVRSFPAAVDAIGVSVGTAGAIPRQLGLGRSRLAELGFTGKVGETLAIPDRDGPLQVAVGVGDAPTSKQLRDAAAAFARAASRCASVATNLADAGSDPLVDAQAVVEGLVLARHRYVAPGAANGTNGTNTHGTNTHNGTNTHGPNGTNGTNGAKNTTLDEIALVASAKTADAVKSGADRGRVTARAARLARQLAETPPNLLTARSIADAAVELASQYGLTAEIYDRDALDVLGCGGILGVNAGSVEPPRMVKLTFAPRRPRGHVALVGKGVMYDSGGISLKPTNPMHAIMKMDMSGAAAVLATMTTLAELGCRNKVTAWLMCTDNMPSGSATKLGDVLTIRNGKTVEIHNTDAEGRLILADGLSLATEESPDVVVDIATLTGAAMAALGQDFAAVIGSDQSVVDALLESSTAADESLWQLPLARDKYRSLLDSAVADMRNVGGPYAGATTAAIFLSEFVGDVPWAHLDIAGPMSADGDNGWKTKGATGFGTRILVDFACNFAAS